MGGFAENVRRFAKRRRPVVTNLADWSIVWGLIRAEASLVFYYRSAQRYSSSAPEPVSVIPFTLPLPKQPILLSGCGNSVDKRGEHLVEAVVHIKRRFIVHLGVYEAPV